MTRVLFVDDDELVRDVFTKALEEANYEVLVASDGNEALIELQNNGPDIVVMDIIMPNKEGIETIIDILKEMPDMPIIAISSGGRLGRLDYLGVSKRLGVAATLNKPFSPRQLIDEIERCLA